MSLLAKYADAFAVEMNPGMTLSAPGRFVAKANAVPVGAGAVIETLALDAFGAGDGLVFEELWGELVGNAGSPSIVSLSLELQDSGAQPIKTLAQPSLTLANLAGGGSAALYFPPPILASFWDVVDYRALQGFGASSLLPMRLVLLFVSQGTGSVNASLGGRFRQVKGMADG